MNLNYEWKFLLGDYPGAEMSAFPDVDWQNIGLPHSFSIPYFLSPEFYTGYGWYRKELLIESDIGKQCYSLEFEGVFQVAEVYLNGMLVGTHRGGYNGFSIDITKAVKKGRNLIAVRVNNIWDPQLAPRAGEHVFSGGIYRDVWLLRTNPLYVAWYGTFVTTPELSAKAGKVKVNTEIQNNGAFSQNSILQTIILDPNGKMVGEINTPFLIEAGKSVTIEQTSSEIANPELWSPENPALYKAVSTIISDNKIIDQYETSFGMRWVEWTADKGFFLNGKHRYFKGVNVHQDHAGWGDAVTNAGFERDVKLMKEAGFDLIRGSHYPHDPAFSAACDKQGMLFWSENIFWGMGGFKAEGDWCTSAYPTLEKDEAGFEHSVKESLKEMIRIHRNHPSVIVWSMCNEPFFTVPYQMPKVRKFLNELVQLSHQLDPTRAAAIGGSQRGDIDKIGDVAGYNGDGAKLYINPGVPNVVSEYGSTIADRPGEYAPGFGELQEEQFDWRSGQAIWCGFDHGSNAGHFGCMGVVDYFRIPKRQWYWYRKNYTNIEPEKWPEPGIPAAIRLTADKTILSSVDGTDDIYLMVTVVDKDGNPVSNSPDVKVEIISGPGEFPTGRTIQFQSDTDIPIRDGKAAIEFRSYNTGKTIIQATSTGLKADRITLISKGKTHKFNDKIQSVSRPYVRFRAEINPEIDSTINLIADRPTKASSSIDGCSPQLANDLNDSTFWQNEGNLGESIWWQVDMENIYKLSRIELSFYEAINVHYSIETSMNGTKWFTIVDRLANTSIEKNRTEIPISENRGRFLRVVFDPVQEGKTVTISDIQAFGKRATLSFQE
jgi:hypothetical protein